MQALSELRRKFPRCGSDRTVPGGPPADVLAAARAQQLPAATGRTPEATVRSDAAVPEPDSKLLVTAGPLKGTEIALAGSGVTLGRAEVNAVVLPDLAVSREHLNFVRGTAAAEWVVVDQGSGNGTYVNGRAVRRQTLRHGDEIVLGDTALRYLEPGGVIAQERAAHGADPLAAPLRPPSMRSWLCGAAAVALVMVFAAGSVRGHRLRLEAEAEARGEAARAIAAARMNTAATLLQQGQPAEARDQLRVALELDGAGPELTRLLDRAEAEIGRAPVSAPSSGDSVPPASRPAEKRPAQASLRERARDSAGQGARHRDVAQALAARHMLAAAAMDGDDDLPRAAAHLRTALENEPGSTAAREALDRVAERARALYLQAYVIKENDPQSALRTLRLVTAALPPDDEVARKALVWLRRLESAEGG